MRHDPYDPERVWVRNPDSSEWITCHARSIRLAALPFGSRTSANLGATEQAVDPHTQWSQDFLDAESARVAAKQASTKKSRKSTDSKAEKKATKAATEKANRKRDSLPRPVESTPTPLPQAVPIRQHPEDYTIA